MPKKLLVIGSGAIGVEFASFYNTLGAETTIVELLNRILPAEDMEISGFAKKQFKKQGIKILENCKVSGIKKKKSIFTVEMEASGKTTSHEFDTIISAVGIVGNTEGIGLEDLKIEVQDTHVVVDEFCQTNVKGIFAIGDLAGAPWLAHKASHEGIMVAELIAGNDPHSVNYNDIPRLYLLLSSDCKCGIDRRAGKRGWL